MCELFLEGKLHYVFLYLQHLAENKLIELDPSCLHAGPGHAHWLSVYHETRKIFPSPLSSPDSLQMPVANKDICSLCMDACVFASERQALTGIDLTPTCLFVLSFGFSGWRVQTWARTWGKFLHFANFKCLISGMWRPGSPLDSSCQELFSGSQEEYMSD